VSIITSAKPADSPAIQEGSIFRIISQLRLLLIIVISGYVIAALYYYYEGVYLARSYPYNTFLCVPPDRFTDFDNMILMCRHLNPYNDYTKSGYPPLANLIYYFFSKMSLSLGFSVFLLTPLAFGVFSINRQLATLPGFYRFLAVLLPFTLSYPVLIAVDRGNLDLWIFMPVGAFLFLYNSSSHWKRDLGCLALASAIALKIYPLPLLLIPFSDRRYADCFKIGIVAVLLSVASASCFFGGAVNAFHDFRQIIAATDAYAKDTVKHAGFSVNFYNCIVILLTKLRMGRLLSWFTLHYWIMAMILMAGYSSLIYWKRLALWESAACLVILFCLVPTLSGDYRVVALLPVILLFLLDVKSGLTYSRIIMILFGLLLVPKNYWELFPDLPPGDVSASSIINPLILFSLLNLILFKSHSSRRPAPSLEASTSIAGGK